jgi:hypothetical protein
MSFTGQARPGKPWTWTAFLLTGARGVERGRAPSPNRRERVAAQTKTRLSSTLSPQPRPLVAPPVIWGSGRVACPAMRQVL